MHHIHSYTYSHTPGLTHTHTHTRNTYLKQPLDWTDIVHSFCILYQSTPADNKYIRRSDLSFSSKPHKTFTVNHSTYIMRVTEQLTACSTQPSAIIKRPINSQHLLQLLLLLLWQCRSSVPDVVIALYKQQVWGSCLAV